MFGTKAERWITCVTASPCRLFKSQTSLRNADEPNAAGCCCTTSAKQSRWRICPSARPPQVCSSGCGSIPRCCRALCQVSVYFSHQSVLDVWKREPARAAVASFFLSLIRQAEPHDHRDLDAVVIFAKRRSPAITLHRRVRFEEWM